MMKEKILKKQASALIPAAWGNFHLIAYAENEKEKNPSLALVHEKFTPGKPVFVRIHSECMTGDVFHSRRCDCGEQLDAAMRIAGEEAGVVIYLRQEGRGIGLINKLKAYNLQDAGLNTAEANIHLGFEADARHYEAAIAILKDLEISQIYLMTNNPAKIKELEAGGIEIVERIPLLTVPKLENESYLHAKQDLMGHLLNMSAG